MVGARSSTHAIAASLNMDRYSRSRDMGVLCAPGIPTVLKHEPRRTFLGLQPAGNERRRRGAASFPAILTQTNLHVLQVLLPYIPSMRGNQSEIAGT